MSSRFRLAIAGFFVLALTSACDGASTFGAGTGGATSVGGAAATAQTTGVGGGGGEFASGGSTAASGGAGGQTPKSFEEQYALDAEFPEGGIYDPAGHAFFVGSLADGSVHRIDANTSVDETVFTETAPGAWWTLGMAVDEARGRLWVCAMEDLSDTEADPAYDGYVWVLDLVTRDRLATFDLSEADAEATCTDVAVASDGTAYVVDRDFGNVYRVTMDDGPSLFVQDSELEGGFVGQNAVVVTPDESSLLIAIYLTSRLVRVNLGTGAVDEIEIDGSFGDLTFLSGADGMTFHEGRLYVAFASELVELTASLGDRSLATATEVDVPNGMTDVVSTPNGLYLLNGQAIRYALGQSTDPFALVRFTGTFPLP